MNLITKAFRQETEKSSKGKSTRVRLTHYEKKHTPYTDSAKMGDRL